MLSHNDDNDAFNFLNIMDLLFTKRTLNKLFIRCVLKTIHDRTFSSTFNLTSVHFINKELKRWGRKTFIQNIFFSPSPFTADNR